MSVRTRPPYDPITMAGDLREVIEDAGADDALLVGHSLGGIVVTMYASQFDTRAVINVDHSELTHDNIAVNATGPGSTIRLNDISMYENVTGLAISNGATIATATNNKTNSVGAAPNGNVTNF